MDSKKNLFAAALAIPGLAATLAPSALAETAPENASIAFKFADYKDWQPGADRMRVKSGFANVVVPFAERFALDATVVTDTMSGASPYYYDTLSGASGKGVRDTRRALDAKISTYFAQGSVGLGGSQSRENDYRSNTYRLEGKLSNGAQTSTLSGSLGASQDRIDNETGTVVGKRKRVRDAVIGFTQVLSPEWLVQANIGHSIALGYLSDPYKPLDRRPEGRHQTTLLLRSNYFVSSVDAVAKTQYRFYRDNWGVISNTLDFTWDQSLARMNDGLRLAPLLRYTSQRGARFFAEPPFGAGFKPGVYYSGDTRLADFGGVSLGLGVSQTFGTQWLVDLKYEHYQQRPSWRLDGEGTQSFKQFSARSISAGVRYVFR